MTDPSPTQPRRNWWQRRSKLAKAGMILLGLFVLGIGKAAVMPVHRWLPAAMVAPTYHDPPRRTGTHPRTRRRADHGLPLRRHRRYLPGLGDA